MPCAEFTEAIDWSKKTTSQETFPVVAYFTMHFGYSSSSAAHRDAVHYASGNVVAVDTPTPHLKGTLEASKNTDQDGKMIEEPKLTYDVEIFPDGTLSYLMKLNGKPVGGLPPTKVQATCLNNVLLTATQGSEVVTVGVARKPSIFTVAVEFKQVANFHEYQLEPDSHGSFGAGDGMFIMYKIKQIKNTGSSAKKFVFDVNKVSTVAPDKTSNETVLNANILLIFQNVTTVTVDPGQTKNVNGCFIKQALTSNPQSLVAAQVPLKYQTDPSQQVKMINLAPNSSVAQVGPALPDALQSLCKSS